MSRRDLVAGAPLVVAGAAPKLYAGCQTNAWKIDAADFSNVLAVLEKIKGYGFAGFETGFRNVQSQFGRPEETKAKLASVGLRFFGLHIFLLEYDPDTLVAPWDLIAKVADGGAALGAERLILSGGHATGDAAIRRKADGLNRAGEYCGKRGLRLAYHNHDKEFLDGRAGIEGLLRHTRRELVHLVMDAGHAFRAQADVTAFFREHHARIDGIHVRDFRADQQVPLGEGEFDLRPLAQEIRRCGWSGWVLAEEERRNDVKPGDSAVAPARRHLSRIFGV